jgi:hypothetical protein
MPRRPIARARRAAFFALALPACGPDDTDDTDRAGDTGPAAVQTEGTVAILEVPVISPEPPAIPLPGPLVSLYGCRDTDSEDDTPDICEANDWSVSPDGATLYPSGPLADTYRIAYLR